MRIPLDHVCVKTGVLCPRCERLVSLGEVAAFEVDVMRGLLELEEKVDFRFLKEARYVKSLEENNMLVLVIELPDLNMHPRVLARLGRALSEKIKRKVRVINVTSGNLRTIAAQLMHPARVIGVNTLWLPDGTVQYVVRILKSDNRYLPASRDTLEQILSSIAGKAVKIRVER